MSENSNFKKYIYSSASFFIPLIIYIITLAPSVSWYDTDELATAASLLKIAHPTGYPLYVLLGKLFTFIPIGDEVYRLNIMSAVFSSAAAAVFFNLMVFIFKELKLTGSDKLPVKKLSHEIVYNISLTSSLLLAFSKTFWDNSNVLEVYSLHVLFIVILIFIFLKAMSLPDTGKTITAGNKYLMLFAFVLGLSFANHMTTTFLLPAFFYLYFAEFGFNKNSVKQLLILLIPFLIALTLYAYLFIGADETMLSWGHTFNLENFIAHVTGRQYNTAMFRSAEDIKIQFMRFIEKYPYEFLFINIALIIPGLNEIFRRSRKLFYFIVILFLSCVALAVNYTIYDIYSYFILTSVVSAIWIAFGILFIVKRSGSLSRQISYIFYLIILLPLAYNYSGADKSKDYIVKDYVYNLFNSAPLNSIVITNYNPTYYFQYVKKVRPDIIFINRDYIYNKWYLNSLIKTYPEIYNKSKAEFDAYSVELDKLQKDKERYLSPKTQTDSRNIINFQTSLRNLLNSIIENNFNEREVFITLETDEVNDEKFAEPFIKTPAGVLQRLSVKKDTAYFKPVTLKYDLTFSDDYFKNYIMNTYYKAHINEAKFYIDNSRNSEAMSLLNKALGIKPDSKEARQLLEKAGKDK